VNWLLHRDLLLLLTSREFKRRFLTVPIGIVFSLFASLSSLLVFSFVFGSTFQERLKAPYALFVLSALVPWTFFQSTLSQSVDAFRANANIVRKVSFPRELVPLSVVSVNVVVMVTLAVALLPFLIYHGIYPNLRWLWFGYALLTVVLFGAGLAMIVSTLSVYFVEVRPLTEVVAMLWFYSTPVFYPSSILPAKLTFIPRVNPLAHIVELARAGLLSPLAPPIESVVFATISAIVSFALGVALVRRQAPVLADDVS
jgi:ABC-type polysaccharide/polyol phosphate export permease